MDDRLVVPLLGPVAFVGVVVNLMLFSIAFSPQSFAFNLCKRTGPMEEVLSLITATTWCKLVDTVNDSDMAMLLEPVSVSLSC